MITDDGRIEQKWQTGQERVQRSIIYLFIYLFIYLATSTNGFRHIKAVDNQKLHLYKTQRTNKIITDIYTYNKNTIYHPVPKKADFN